MWECKCVGMRVSGNINLLVLRPATPGAAQEGEQWCLEFNFHSERLVILTRNRWMESQTEDQSLAGVWSLYLAVYPSIYSNT